MERMGKKEEQVPHRRVGGEKRSQIRHKVACREEKRKEITRAFMADGGLNM